MSEWAQVELGIVSEIVMGQSPPGCTYNEDGVGMPLINGPVEYGKKHPTPVQWTSAPAKTCVPGDILFCVRGSTTGRINISNDFYCIGRGVAAIRGKTGVAATGYLEFVLRVLANEVLEEARGSGSTFPSVTGGRLASSKVLLPPEPHQRRIAEILTTVDEVIEATEKLVEKQRQIQAGLMHDLFTRGLWTRAELARGDHKGLPCEATAQEGQLRPPPDQAPDLYQDSPLGLIPKSWQVVTTLDCALDSPGSTTIGPFGSDLVSADYQTAGIPVVFVRDVKATGFEWNSDVYVSQEKARRLSAHSVRPGDILSSKMGLPPCISCIYPDWMPEGIITADMIRVRPDISKATSQWLSAALNGDAFKRQVQTITAGVTRPKVTLSDFRKLRLPRPLLEEQKLIDALLIRHKNVLSAENQHLAKLRQQKQGLMHDLLTGGVTVSQ